MGNGNLNRKRSFNEASDIVILKPEGAVAVSSDEKRKRMSDDTRGLLKDLAIMATISALVLLTAIIIYKL